MTLDAMYETMSTEHCSNCGRRSNTTGRTGRKVSSRGTKCKHCRYDVPKWLNLAHETHDPRTSSTIFLCPACHQRHDTGRRIFVARRNHAREFGQLWLLPEIELERFVVFPVQLHLF